MNFWRMQRFFSLPAVRNQERTKIDVYCNPDRWRQKHRKNQFLLQYAASQQTGFYDYLGRKGKPWQIICELNYAAKHWKMRACDILIFAEQLYIPIGAASIQVLRTELLSKNMALSRAWIVLDEDAMIMQDVKVYGQEWRRSCFITGAEDPKIIRLKH